MLKQLVNEVQATMSIYEAQDDQVSGVLAEYAHPGELLHAAQSVREAGYSHFDTYSPFPIHGMDKAMGLKNSIIGWITLGAGATGLALATWMQWWMGEVNYPLNISGKPFFAIEPSVPVMFEVTILFAALATVAGMFALNGLPRHYNPLFYSKNFLRVTDDAFFLQIAASDNQFDMTKTSQMLKDLGASNIETIRDTGEEG
jgi:hypothetical protein